MPYYIKSQITAAPRKPLSVKDWALGTGPFIHEDTGPPTHKLGWVIPCPKCSALIVPKLTATKELAPCLCGYVATMEEYQTKGVWKKLPA